MFTLWFSFDGRPFNVEIDNLAGARSAWDCLSAKFTALSTRP